ncbi:MAG: hypothetical protein IJF48_00325 [Clostridia bacterium]|nr:hypothetical protein [Clostridia bacterium]
MKFNIYTKLLCTALAVLLISVLFTLGASATLGFRSGGISGGANSRSSDSLDEGTADENGIVHEPDTSGDNMMGGGSGSGANNGNSGSVNGGSGNGGNDSAAGTGEFGDDTSNTLGAATDDTSRDSGNGPVESVIDGIGSDAAGAADDATNGMSIWGIIIVIAIIAAIAVLVFAFFSKRK